MIYIKNARQSITMGAGIWINPKYITHILELVDGNGKANGCRIYVTGMAFKYVDTAEKANSVATKIINAVAGRPTITIDTLNDAIDKENKNGLRE